MAFVTVGVYALIFMWVVRVVSAKLVDIPATESLGKALGATVHFG